MAGKKKQDSALIAAALAFDEALDAHGRAAELFVRTPLATTRQLERANELLDEIAAAEEQLRVRGAALGAAVTEARDRQEKDASAVVARLPYLKERNLQLQALLQTFQVLGADAVELNSSAAGASPADLAARVTAMSERAAALAGDARVNGFEELANQAHALHQRLAATARKLQPAVL